MTRSALFFVLATWACVPNSDGDRDAIELSGLGVAIATGLCDGVEKCQGQDFLSQQKDCVGRWSEWITAGLVPAIVEGVRVGRINYFPSLVPACQAALAECGMTNHLPVECLDAISGTVALENSCKTDLDCLGDRYCFGDTCPGVCRSWHQAHESCARDDDCQRGLRCNLFTKNCFQPKDVGEACVADIECGYFMLCVVGEGDDLRRCWRQRTLETGKLNQPCGNYENPISSPFCDPDLACLKTGDTTGNCYPKGGISEECSPAYPDQCPADAFCNGIPGICAPLPTTGQSCVSVSGSDRINCAAGYYCDDTATCQPLRTFHAACTESKQCASQACFGSLCTPDWSCDPSQSDFGGPAR